MADGAIINSDSYWNGRFLDDWETYQGPGQSRFFARLALENLPHWLFEQVRRENLTVADWGCAQGDGTDCLASYVDPRQLVGVDFSQVAIKQAETRYPAIRFLNENWIDADSAGVELFDVIFSSNTLEHFHSPWEVLHCLGRHARKAVVLALPYREMERIDEHFYSFLPGNVPVELSNGFSLVWSKVIDCRIIENTHWSGEQIFLVYAEKSWLSSLKLTLGDCEIGSDDFAAFLEKETSTRDALIRELRHELAAQSDQLTDLEKSLRDREAQITSLSQEMDGAGSKLSSLRQENAMQLERINAFANSRSWRITRPLRLAGSCLRALFDASERYHLLKKVYWALPEKLRAGLNQQRYRYVARNLHVRDAAAPARSPLQASPDWLIAANAAQKVAVIPCGFEFDELVNQRPINAAKYFSQQGYVVIFIAWQWSRGELLKKPTGQVWPEIHQVPLFEFIDFEKSMAPRQLDALYLLTMPARVLVDLAPSLRARGYSIAYDVMDEWEEFQKSGQAPWFERDVERNMVLQSDVVSAVAPALIEKFSAIRDDIELIGNGYSVQMLGADCRGIAGRSNEGSLTVGYFGHLTDAWFDWPVVFALAQSRPDVRFELIGYGEPEWVRERVSGIENIHLLGKVHPKELHLHVQRWKFGLIPFVEGDLSRAVDPIKIYEYLYFGLPSFVTGIEHLASYPHVFFSRSAEAVQRFEGFLASAEEENENLEEFLKNSTWDARFSQLQACLARKMIIGNMYAS